MYFAQFNRFKFALNLSICVYIIADFPTTSLYIHIREYDHQPHSSCLSHAVVMGEPAPVLGEPAPILGEPAPVLANQTVLMGEPAPFLGEPAPVVDHPGRPHGRHPGRPVVLVLLLSRALPTWTLATSSRSPVFVVVVDPPAPTSSRDVWDPGDLEPKIPRSRSLVMSCLSRDAIADVPHVDPDHVDVDPAHDTRSPCDGVKLSLSISQLSLPGQQLAVDFP